MNTFTEMINRLHSGVNPYDNFNYDPKDVNLFNGWGSEHKVFDELISELKPKVVLEIGSFLGGSAIKMARKLKELNLNSVVICLDTWLAEEILHSFHEHKEKLRIRHGRATFYHTFMANVLNEKLENYIIPISMPSPSGLRYLKFYNIKADMVYIDGSHIEGEVFRDMEGSWNILNPGGVMLMDDYDQTAVDYPSDFRGLIKDVNQFAKSLCLSIELQREKAIIRKP